MTTSTVLSGYFVLEGLDGSGTTTQWNLWMEAVKHRPEAWSFVREPTENPIGKLIRTYLKGAQGGARETLAQLFAADRWEQMFRPTTGTAALLAEGTRVLSDRSLLSSLAYQACELGFERVLAFNSGFPLPQTVFFLDIAPETGLKRVEARGGRREIFENLAYQTRIRDQYRRALDWVSEKGTRVVSIDATLLPLEIHEKIKGELLEGR